MLTQNDRTALSISSFVFHILKKEDDLPKYLDRVELLAIQRARFREWLLKGLKFMIEYEFIDDEALLHNASAKIGLDEEGFVAYTKEIARDFKRTHKGSSSDGILVFCQVDTQSGNLLFMIKVGYKDTFQYSVSVENGMRIATVSTVENPIIDDFDEIQKIALINLDSSYEWSILAYDKLKKSLNTIAVYFKKFLHVRETKSNSELTRLTFSTVLKWYKVYKHELDPGQTVSHYKGRALEYFERNTHFETERFLEHVVIDQDNTRKEQAKETLLNHLRNSQLDGRLFESRPQSIPNAQTRSTWKTDENVKIIFEGNPDSNGIEKTTALGETEIKITTTNLSIE